ncbi:MAG: thioesterase family protein [Planctomycetota bacterium]
MQHIPIRFADVDAAGIVYYPSFFHFYHMAFEDFFANAHGTHLAEWVGERGIGFPTTHLEADFCSPLRYGETLNIAITIPRIGESSFDFRFEARTGQSHCAAWSLVTKVCVNMDSLRPLPIPEELRRVFQRYGGAE